MTLFEYDALGQETARVLPGGQRSMRAYDAEGRLAREVDENGGATEYGYDADGRLTEVRYADGLRSMTTYTPTGQVATVTDREGGVTRREYDAVDRLRTETESWPTIRRATYSKGNAMTLLDGRLEPITSEFGFIRAPLRVVAAWLAEREAEWTRERGVTISSTPVPGGLQAALRCLLPLTSVERRRMLAMPTTSPWTAIFENGWQGGDAAILSLAATELRCQAVRIVAVADAAARGRQLRYGARIFELYGAHQTDFLNCIRTISVANDGGRWRFDQAGTPLAGEDARWFAAKLVKHRFKEEHLEALLCSLGIEAFDENFYGDQGVVIERHGPTAVGLREYDLAEVQAQWQSGS